MVLLLSGPVVPGVVPPWSIDTHGAPLLDYVVQILFNMSFLKFKDKRNVVKITGCIAKDLNSEIIFRSEYIPIYTSNPLYDALRKVTS